MLFVLLQGVNPDMRYEVQYSSYVNVTADGFVILKRVVKTESFALQVTPLITKIIWGLTVFWRWIIINWFFYSFEQWTQQPGSLELLRSLFRSSPVRLLSGFSLNAKWTFQNEKKCEFGAFPSSGWSELTFDGKRRYRQQTITWSVIKCRRRDYKLGTKQVVDLATSNLASWEQIERSIGITFNC